MHATSLIDFLEHQMSMTDVYQPAVIRELLLHDGTQTKSQLAASLASYDLAVQDYYERVVMRWPRLTLQKHGIVEYSRKGHLFKLCDFPINDEVRRRAIEICSAKITTWLARKTSRTSSSGRSASLRYQVLKSALGKCALCGIPSQLRPIDVDHIIPRSKANKNGKVQKSGKWIDVDSEENLQALCISCNRAKRDSDQTDFRRKEKLVRDRVPELIRADGREPIIKTLHGNALLSALQEKLVEEHAEFIAAENTASRLEELADMIELIDALAIQLGATSEDLTRLVRQKRDQRGGFKMGLLYRGDQSN